MNDETVIAPAGGRQFVGKYRIDGVLGEGAMGVVYAGQDPDIDRPVAIKTIHPHLISAAGSQEWLDRFAREARAAGRVLHPNLVTVFDFLQQDGVPYLVMERVRSITLEDRRAAPQPMPLREIHAIMSQILSGLACIHAAGIVHRDLKPANVMLTEDGTAKLTDFGIARLTAMEATGAGMAGTPSYMAPEQMTGSEVDARADIYACGVILYELLTGRKPYKGGGAEALFSAMRNFRVIPPREIVPSLPAAIDQLVLTAMNLDPDQRFDSARRMRDELAAVLPKADATGLIDIASDTLPAALLDSSASPTMITRLSSQSLRRVEEHLTSNIGPMGRVIARRAAASATSTKEIIETVLLEFSDPTERQELRVALERVLAELPASPSVSGFSEESLRCLADLLKTYLGPIASILVKKLSPKATSFEELAQNLAEHIADARERERFLNAAKNALQ